MPTLTPVTTMTTEAVVAPEAFRRTVRASRPGERPTTGDADVSVRVIGDEPITATGPFDRSAYLPANYALLEELRAQAATLREGGVIERPVECVDPVLSFPGVGCTLANVTVYETNVAMWNGARTGLQQLLAAKPAWPGDPQRAVEWCKRVCNFIDLGFWASNVNPLFLLPASTATKEPTCVRPAEFRGDFTCAPGEEWPNQRKSLVPQWTALQRAGATGASPWIQPAYLTWSRWNSPTKIAAFLTEPLTPSYLVPGVTNLMVNQEAGRDSGNRAHVLAVFKDLRGGAQSSSQHRTGRGLPHVPLMTLFHEFRNDARPGVPGARGQMRYRSGKWEAYGYDPVQLMSPASQINYCAALASGFLGLSLPLMVAESNEWYVNNVLPFFTYAGLSDLSREDMALLQRAGREARFDAASEVLVGGQVSAASMMPVLRPFAALIGMAIGGLFKLVFGGFLERRERCPQPLTLRQVFCTPEERAEVQAQARAAEEEAPPPPPPAKKGVGAAWALGGAVVGYLLMGGDLFGEK